MSNPLGLTLQDILGLEDSPALLAFRCDTTGIVAWPLIRATFLRLILSDLLYRTPMSAGRRASPASARGASFLLRSAAHNRRNRRRWPSDVCLMSSGLGLIDKGGRAFDRLTDHFAMALPERTLVREDSHDWRWPFPRHFERVHFQAPLSVWCELEGRVLVGRRHRRMAEALVDEVSARAGERLHWVPGADQRKRLVELLSRKLPQVPPMYRRYRDIFRRQRTRLLIKEDGSYGPSAVILAAARSLGIVVAEHQHGAISAGHDAYNVAPTMATCPDFLRTMPEYFLGFGQWWNEQINMPPRRLAIGNPHRSETLAAREARRTSKPPQTDILVLGDGIETALYLDLVRSLVPLARRLGRRLVFRPHPLERDRLPPGGGDGFSVDLRPDIYDSFDSAYAVISEISTGLFEAVGLAGRVVLWETEKARFNYPRHTFERFSDLDELSSLLQRDADRGLDVDDVARIWAPGWRESYLAFVGSAMSATEGLYE